MWDSVPPFDTTAELKGVWVDPVFVGLVFVVRIFFYFNLSVVLLFVFRRRGYSWYEPAHRDQARNAEQEFMTKLKVNEHDSRIIKVCR